MKKLCGFALICFSIGMVVCCLLNGFTIKLFLITACLVAGCICFH